jgi:hypothetical protein
VALYSAALDDIKKREKHVVSTTVDKKTIERIVRDMVNRRMISSYEMFVDLSGSMSERSTFAREKKTVILTNPGTEPSSQLVADFLDTLKKPTIKRSDALKKEPNKKRKKVIGLPKGAEQDDIFSSDSSSDSSSDISNNTSMERSSRIEGPSRHHKDEPLGEADRWYVTRMFVRLS